VAPDSLASRTVLPLAAVESGGGCMVEELAAQPCSIKIETDSKRMYRERRTQLYDKFEDFKVGSPAISNLQC